MTGKKLGISLLALAVSLGLVIYLGPFSIASIQPAASAFSGTSPAGANSSLNNTNPEPGQTYNTPPGKQHQPPQQTGSLTDILKQKNIPAHSGGFKILITKSSKTLAIFYNNTWLKSYPVEFGEGGPEDKEKAGDRKTPEGTFYVCEKSVLSPPDQYLGSRWMRLSYPNIEDAERGLKAGLINQQVHDEIVTAFKNVQVTPQRTALGGGIGIHGGGTPELGANWTWGCIGLKNSDVEDFYDYITVGTPVIIQK